MTPQQKKEEKSLHKFENSIERHIAIVIVIIIIDSVSGILIRLVLYVLQCNWIFVLIFIVPLEVTLNMSEELLYWIIFIAYPNSTEWSGRDEKEKVRELKRGLMRGNCEKPTKEWTLSKSKNYWSRVQTHRNAKQS